MTERFAAAAGARRAAGRYWVASFGGWSSVRIGQQALAGVSGSAVQARGSAGRGDGEARRAQRPPPHVPSTRLQRVCSLARFERACRRLVAENGRPLRRREVWETLESRELSAGVDGALGGRRELRRRTQSCRSPASPLLLSATIFFWREDLLLWPLPVLGSASHASQQSSGQKIRALGRPRRPPLAPRRPRHTCWTSMLNVDADLNTARGTASHTRYHIDQGSVGKYTGS